MFAVFNVSCVTVIATKNISIRYLSCKTLSVIEM